MEQLAMAPLERYPAMPAPGGTVRRVIGRYRPAPASAARDVDEEVTQFGRGWCEEGCLWLPEWGVLAATRQLKGALAIAYHYNPGWRPFGQIAVEHRTQIVWEELEPSTGGHHLSRANRIELNTTLQDEPSSVLAAVLAHEVVHAARINALNLRAQWTPGICLKEELLAFAWQADTWLKVRKGTERTSLARAFDGLVAAWRAHRLQEWVLLAGVYQEQCLGERLPVL